MFLGWVSLYDKIFIFPVAPHRNRLSHWREHIRIQKQNTLIMEPRTLSCPESSRRCTSKVKLIYCHHCQWLVFFVPSLASFDETTDSASVPICSLRLWHGYPCRVHETFLAEILRLARLKLTLVLVVFPGVGMWVCCDRGSRCCAAKECIAHTSVDNIEPSKRGPRVCCGVYCGLVLSAVGDCLSWSRHW